MVCLEALALDGAVGSVGFLESGVLDLDRVFAEGLVTGVFKVAALGSGLLAFFFFAESGSAAGRFFGITI